MLYAEETNSEIIVYFYDQNGAPVGFQYRGADYASGVWDLYAYEKNIFGDIVAVYDSNGTKLVSYAYNAWGECTVTNHTTVPTVVANNAYRYRSYYYDSDLDMYYLQSRYYDANICRFINADGQISGVGGDIRGYNLFAYCMNNPVNMTDDSGNWPKWATKLVTAVAIVAVVAVVAAVTVATAGTGTAAACVAVGAAKGAAVGLAVGAATGAASGAISHRISTGSWDGAGEAVLNGMADGALSGTITGVISGGVSAGLRYGTFSSKSSLIQHYTKHGYEFGDMYTNAKEYAQGAKYVIKNGTYIPEKNAYIKFLGTQGKANYAFVGMKAGGKISTYHVRSVSKMIKDGISIFY